MNIKHKRIKDLLRINSLKQKDAAELLGVTAQTFNNWMFRKVFPDYEQLKKLAKILKVDADELIDAREAKDPKADYFSAAKSGAFDTIPFYTNEINSDRIEFWKNETIEEPKDFIHLPGLKADFIFPFYGSGMEPIIKNGDWVALRRITDFSFFNFGQIHLIITKEQAIIRSIRKGPKKNTLLLTAENSFNDEIEINTKSIEALFIVVTVIKRIVL